METSNNAHKPILCNAYQKALAFKEILDILESVPAQNDAQAEVVDQPARRVATKGLFEFDSESDEDIEVEENSLEQKAKTIFTKWDEAKFKRKEYGQDKLEEWGEDPTEFFQDNKLKYLDCTVERPRFDPQRRRLNDSFPM